MNSDETFVFAYPEEWDYVLLLLTRSARIQRSDPLKRASILRIARKVQNQKEKREQ